MTCPFRSSIFGSGNEFFSYKREKKMYTQHFLPRNKRVILKQNEWPLSCNGDVGQCNSMTDDILFFSNL